MDLRDGNPSLPIILALEDPVVREAFEQPQCVETRIVDALQAIKRGPAIEQAKDLARNYAEAALKSIEKFPPSAYRNGLKTLVQLIIDRDF
jgi:all-trans-nonaprenyl-diphosphate synthase